MPDRMTDFFDTRADGYDKQMAQKVKNFNAFYTAAAQPIPATDFPVKILDLGCGTGLELVTIFNRVPNAQITAIDLSENMLGRLRHKNVGRLGQIEIIQGSYLELPFGRRLYDYTISVMTLHHLLPEKKLCLYEKIYQALKIGGKYIEADYVVSKEKEAKLLADYHKKTGINGQHMDGVFHLDIPMSVKTLRDLLTTAGFVNIEITWQHGDAVVIEARCSSDAL
jgi:tRNA (cmo5U34)-methyltransferase